MDFGNEKKRQYMQFYGLELVFNGLINGWSWVTEQLNKKKICRKYIVSNGTHSDLLSGALSFQPQRRKRGSGDSGLNVNLAVGPTVLVKQYGFLSLPASQPTQQGTHTRPLSPCWPLLRWHALLLEFHILAVVCNEHGQRINFNL